MNTIANTLAGTPSVPQTRFEQKLMPGQSPCLMKHGLPRVVLLSPTVMLSSGLDMLRLVSIPRATLWTTVVCGLQPPQMWRLKFTRWKFEPPLPVPLTVCLIRLGALTLLSTPSIVLPVLLRVGFYSVVTLVVT